MRKRFLTAVAVLALVVGGLGVAMTANSATANTGVCPGTHHGGSGPTATITADPGYLIASYCVKAGSVHQGNGPEFHTVNPPQPSVTISHSSGKDISHYSYTQVPISSPSPTPTPTVTVTPTPTSTPTPTVTPSPTDPTSTPTDPGPTVTPSPTDPVDPCSPQPFPVPPCLTETPDPTGPPTLIPPTSTTAPPTQGPPPGGPPPANDGPSVESFCSGNALIVKHYDADGNTVSTATFEGHRRCASGRPGAPAGDVREEGM